MASRSSSQLKEWLQETIQASGSKGTTRDRTQYGVPLVLIDSDAGLYVLFNSMFADIEADNLKIGLICVVPTGKVEVSTRDVTVKVGQHVKEGEHFGMASSFWPSPHDRLWTCSHEAMVPFRWLDTLCFVSQRRKDRGMSPAWA